MRWWAWLIIIIILCSGSLTGGYFLGRGSCPDVPQVTDETPTENESVDPPAGPDVLTWYIIAYRKPIDITGQFRPDKSGWFDVRATDTYKTAYKSFKIVTPAKERRLSIQLMPFFMAGYNSQMNGADVFVGGQVSVLRNYGLFSVGGAGLYSYSLITKDHYGGAGAVFGFNP